MSPDRMEGMAPPIWLSRVGASDDVGGDGDCDATAGVTARGLSLGPWLWACRCFAVPGEPAGRGGKTISGVSYGYLECDQRQLRTNRRRDGLGSAHGCNAGLLANAVPASAWTQKVSRYYTLTWMEVGGEIFATHPKLRAANRMHPSCSAASSWYILQEIAQETDKCNKT